MISSLDLKLIQLGVEEDLGVEPCDVTSELLFEGAVFETGSAKIISKHPTDIVVAGLVCVEPILEFLDSVVSNSGGLTAGSIDEKKGPAVKPRGFVCTILIPDGGILRPGETLLTLEGSPILLLKAERLILNFLRHLSAVATMTSLFVKAVAGTSAKILDTRKTTPGFRSLEKYAVACGGGVNHRMGLYDAIMVKDTHVDLLGGMKNALSRLPLLEDSELLTIVEVRSMDELKIVLDEGLGKVSRVLLDNIRGSDLKECIEACRGVFETEASGNINLNNVREVADSGVDFISVGMITHSAGQVDLSMKSTQHG